MPRPKISSVLARMVWAMASKGKSLSSTPKGFNFLGDGFHADQNVKDQHHHRHGPPPKGVDEAQRQGTTYKKMNFFMNML